MHDKTVKIGVFIWQLGPALVGQRVRYPELNEVYYQHTQKQMISRYQFFSLRVITLLMLFLRCDYLLHLFLFVFVWCSVIYVPCCLCNWPYGCCASTLIINLLLLLLLLLLLDRSNWRKKIIWLSNGRRKMWKRCTIC